MKRPFCLLVLFSLIFFPKNAYAQEEKHLFTAELYGGIYTNNENAWLVEPTVSWNFHKYLGLSFGVELTSQYNQPTRQTIIDGYESELADNERNVRWIMFKPALIIKSPALWKSRDDYFKLWVQIEPGLSFACPFHNSLTYEIREFSGNTGHTVDYRTFRNKDLNWLYWGARTSIKLSADRFVFGAGYNISNLDYYSGRRNVTPANGQKFYVPKKELSQSIFISIGYTL